ncbi:MAG: nucleotide disphospho-sugar-binding domain-containing protein [Planctomycetota bacterium]|jgi:spore coat polysaccharide biosynthesis predicted glycosyltransferase SpsG
MASNGSQRTKGKIRAFLEENSQKTAELYGGEFAEQRTWGQELAAKLIIAYINRERGDRLWYKKAANIRRVTSESERKLIVCTCRTGFLSHTSRALMVAEELRDLGHEVVFIVDTETKPDQGGNPTQRKYFKLIKEDGFEIYHAPFLVGEDAIEKVREHTANFYSVGTIEEETEGFLSALKNIEEKNKKPDLMLIDGAHVARIPADIMAVPTASIWNFFISNYNKCCLTLPERYPLRKVLLRIGGDKLVRLFEKLQITRLVSKILVIKWVAPYNFVRLKYMMKEKRWIGLRRNLFSQIGGDVNLFSDYVAFGGMKINHEALPVGPINWEPSIDISKKDFVNAFEQFVIEDKAKPLIYVSMGSSGELALFKLIIDGLKGKDYRIVITTGEQFDISKLGELPANCFAIPLYPGTDICEEASIMINHGGSGSTNQAIMSTLPQISIPTTMEQQWNSDLVVRKGLGKQIFPGDLTADSLNAAVEELLS